MNIYIKCRHPCKEDFITFGTRIGVLPKKPDAVISMFCENHPLIDDLVAASTLDAKTQRSYLRSHHERLQRFFRSTR